MGVTAAKMGAGAKAPVSLMAGYWGGMAVEPPRPIGDFRRVGPHKGTVSWYRVTNQGGWLIRIEPLTDR